MDELADFTPLICPRSDAVTLAHRGLCAGRGTVIGKWLYRRPNSWLPDERALERGSNAPGASREDTNA